MHSRVSPNEVTEYGKCQETEKPQNTLWSKKRHPLTRCSEPPFRYLDLLPYSEFNHSMPPTANNEDQKWKTWQKDRLGGSQVPWHKQQSPSWPDSQEVGWKPPSGCLLPHRKPPRPTLLRRHLDFIIDLPFIWCLVDFIMDSECVDFVSYHRYWCRSLVLVTLW